MIALDTSALMALILKEQGAHACEAVIRAADGLVISAGTLAEALIVAGGRGFEEEMSNLIAQLRARVIELTQESSFRVARAYRQWGRGYHPAALNFGDCFAYEVAKQYNCPLLYIGNDFAKTDIASAL